MLLRRVADYGGILNGLLCGVHCAAGPLLLTWWGSRHPAAVAEHWELVFLGLSGVLVVLATRQHSSGRLRGAFGGLYALFVVTALLAGRWPWLEFGQYAASAGLIALHWLNQRHCRRCLTQPPTLCLAGCGGPDGQPLRPPAG